MLSAVSSDCYEKVVPVIPKLDILPPPQRRFWKQLDAIPPEFVLYGGTAIALHLGHRQSVDFDFFCFSPIDPDHLLSNLEFLQTAEVLQQMPDTLTCRVKTPEPVKLSFFGLPRLKQLFASEEPDGSPVRIANKLDLAGMKAAVVQRRAEAKDYLDLDALIRDGISLGEACSAACAIYGPQLNPQLTLKALSYFGEGDLDSLEESVKYRLLGAVKSTDPNHLPSIASRC